MTTFMRMIMVVDEADVGGFIRELGGRVKSLDFETVEIKDGRAKRGSNGKAEDLLAFLSKPMRPMDLRAKSGVSEASIYSRLAKLREKKLIRKRKDGMWEKTK